MGEEYKKLLKDIRWIFKRRVILKRDEYKCTNCGSKEKLNVHHIFYSGGYPPWQYPDDWLITLCSTCHKEWHETHAIEYRSHPQGSPKRVSKRKPKRKVRVKRKIKKPKIKNRTNGNGYRSIAQKQKKSRTNKYRKKVNGTWVTFEK